MKKKRRLTEADKAYIRENKDKMTLREIAGQLKCPPSVIQAHLKEVGAGEGIKSSLRNSEGWKRLREEFTADELKYFEEQYINTMSQFGGNIVSTEERQIMQVVKLEVLQSRALIQQRRIKDETDRLIEQKLELLAARGGQTGEESDEINIQIFQLEERILSNQKSDASFTAEYTKLQKEVGDLMKALKATRDQRVKDFEQSKESLLGLFKVLENREIREQEEKRMELIRLSAQKERERLSRPHKYGDGKVDRPLLTPETLDLD